MKNKEFIGIFALMLTIIGLLIGTFISTNARIDALHTRIDTIVQEIIIVKSTLGDFSELLAGGIELTPMKGDGLRPEIGLDVN